MEWLLRASYRAARRIVVGVVGGSLVLLGVAMVFLPGPAVVVIPLGLAILGMEFAWARRWLRRLKEAARDASSRIPGSGDRRAEAPSERETARSPGDPPETSVARQSRG
jgi:tellurite resistance protein TerC